MSIVRVLLALLLLMPISAGAQTVPKLSGRVVDEAHLLSPEQVAQLTQLSDDVEKASSRQFVIATIPDLQDYPIEDYGNKLIRTWGIGQKGANNGIILIVAPKDRKVRIEVGYGLEPIMTDALSSTIINDTILPKFRDKDIPGGIVAGAQAIGEQMKLPLEAAEARAQQQAQKAAPQRQRSNGSGGIPIGLIFWGIILAFVIIPMFAGRRRSRRGPWGARSYRRGGDGGSALPIILWTIANEIGQSSSRGGWGGGSGGGGGWGGGGGGGGGFSGGGGSGGGGGASGSW